MISRPMIAQWQAPSGGDALGTVVIDPAADGVLTDHVYKNTPLLPAAAIIEIFAEAAECLGRTTPPTVLEQIRFLNGVRCFTSAPQTLHIRLTEEQGTYECRLTQEFRNRTGTLLDAARLCTSARIPAKHPSFDDWGWQSTPTDNWRNVIYQPGSGNRLGPSLHGLKSLRLEEDRGWGVIIAGEEAPWKKSSSAPWRFSPGVLDAALVACNLWVFTYRPGAMQVPMEMRRIWLGENPAPGSRLETSFHVQQVTDTAAAYDVRVRDAAGKIVLKIDDYCVALIREPGDNPLRLDDPGSPRGAAAQNFASEPPSTVTTVPVT